MSLRLFGICSGTVRAACAGIRRRPELSRNKSYITKGASARHSEGIPLPVAVEALRKMLHDFNGRSGARMSAIVSRSGVPVAWSLPEDVQVDNFATMAATLLGALEVIYSTMKSDTPRNVTVESEGGVLTVRDVTGKMFFVSLAEKSAAAHGKAIDDAIAKARGLLGES